MEQLTKIFADLYQYGVVLAMVIALWGVLSWPGIRGKGWLVGALLVTLSAELGSIVVQLMMRQFGPEMIMGPDDYQYLWQASFVLGGCHCWGNIYSWLRCFSYVPACDQRGPRCWLERDLEVNDAAD